MQWCSLLQRTLQNAEQYKQYKEPMQWLVDHLSEALCLTMGSEGLLSLLSSNLYPLGLLSGTSLPRAH